MGSDPIWRAVYIEELEISPSRKVPAIFTPGRGMNNGGILMRSDKKTVYFGGHLPEAELRYLHSLIRSIIASSDQSPHLSGTIIRMLCPGIVGVVDHIVKIA